MKIRIIPMSNSDTEFVGKNIKEIQQDYFMNTLKVEHGWYYYGKRGIDAKTGDLFLFQMDNCIIASANFEDIIRFKRETFEGNKGVFILDIKTIKIFKPITAEELHELIPEFTRFSQAKLDFDSNNMNLKDLQERFNCYE